MLLGFVTVVIMLSVAYAYLREGLFTACTMAINVFLAGLVAFNFWEPLASILDPMLAGTFLHGYEDAFCLVPLFSLTLGFLRALTNNLAGSRVEFQGWLQSGGGILFGLITGYLVSGFLVCVLQTLPWHENFMFFEPKYETGREHLFRHVLPPDRVWLGLMHRAGAYAFSNHEDPKQAASPLYYDRYVTFDKYGNFELRYARYRRYGDNRGPMPYVGEFDQQLAR
jgi:Colicin V production protein